MATLTLFSSLEASDGDPVGAPRGAGGGGEGGKGCPGRAGGGGAIFGMGDGVDVCLGGGGGGVAAAAVVDGAGAPK